MVRLITNYNRILNEKVFVLTGEEDYARTTETLLEMLEFSDTYSDLSKYRLGFKIDVLRDKGDSSYVTLYDRDEVLGVFDWNQSMGDGLVIGKEGGASSTNPLNHGYDMNYSMEHDFYVKFSGNKKCLPSESVHIDKYVEATNETRIDWLVNPESATEEGSLTVNVGLICGDLTLTRDKPVKFYIDDVYDGTSDTNEESVAEYTFTNIEGGHHTIKAVFEGDEILSASENSYETMSGYKLTFQDIPLTYVMGQSVPIKVLVTDYDGNPIQYAEVALYDEYNDPLDVSGIADENGLVDLVLTVNSPFKAKCGNYESTVFRPNWVDNESLQIDITKSENYAPSNIKINIYNGYSGDNYSGLLVPVTIQSLAGFTTTNYFTNDMGEINFTYPNNCVGDVTISVNLVVVNKSISIEDDTVYFSIVKGKHGRTGDSLYNEIYTDSNVGRFGLFGKEVVGFLTPNVDKCNLSMTILNDSSIILLLGTGGQDYRLDLVKHDVIRITPEGNWKYNVDVGKNVGYSNEKWERKYSSIDLNRIPTYSGFLIAIHDQFYFDEFKIKRVK